MESDKRKNLIALAHQNYILVSPQDYEKGSINFYIDNEKSIDYCNALPFSKMLEFQGKCEPLDLPSVHPYWILKGVSKKSYNEILLEYKSSSVDGSSPANCFLKKRRLEAKCYELGIPFEEEKPEEKKEKKENTDTHYYDEDLIF